MTCILQARLITLCLQQQCAVGNVQFEWRNGWFYEQSKSAKEQGRQDPFPKHTAALKEVGAI